MVRKAKLFSPAEDGLKILTSDFRLLTSNNLSLELNNLPYLLQKPGVYV